MYREPLGYFVTFRTYGTWLHGDVRGSVDRVQNQFGSARLRVDAELEEFEAEEMEGSAVEFCNAMRTVVECTVCEVCRHKGWTVHAVNVRTNHVHVVVSALCEPEKVMNTFKAWGTRRLVEAGLVERSTRVWSRHGSTQYLFTAEKMMEACDYVINGQ